MKLKNSQARIVVVDTLSLEIKNHYAKYSKKELYKLVLELYNDNVTMLGQLKNANRQIDDLMAKNIELALKITQEK